MINQNGIALHASVSISCSSFRVGTISLNYIRSVCGHLDRSVIINIQVQDMVRVGIKGREVNGAYPVKELYTRVMLGWIYDSPFSQIISTTANLAPPEISRLGIKARVAGADLL